MGCEQKELTEPVCPCEAGNSLALNASKVQTELRLESQFFMGESFVCLNFHKLSL